MTSGDHPVDRNRSSTTAQSHGRSSNHRRFGRRALVDCPRVGSESPIRHPATIRGDLPADRAAMTPDPPCDLHVGLSTFDPHPDLFTLLECQRSRSRSCRSRNTTTASNLTYVSTDLSEIPANAPACACVAPRDTATNAGRTTNHDNLGRPTRHLPNRNCPITTLKRPRIRGSRDARRWGSGEDDGGGFGAVPPHRDLGRRLDLAADHRQCDHSLLAGHRGRTRDRADDLVVARDLGAARRDRRAGEGETTQEPVHVPRESIRHTSSCPMKQPLVNETASISRPASCGIVESSMSMPWVGTPAAMRSASNSSADPRRDPDASIQA